MAGEAAASGLRFFLDCGLGSVVVPGALRAAGWLLETMDERYGEQHDVEFGLGRYVIGIVRYRLPQVFGPAAKSAQVSGNAAYERI
jgi:hypothetical protein